MISDRQNAEHLVRALLVAVQFTLYVASIALTVAGVSLLVLEWLLDVELAVLEVAICAVGLKLAQHVVAASEARLVRRALSKLERS